MIKSIFILFVFTVQLLAAIQAPYLVSLTNKATETSSYVSITWRNNDIATNGFLIYRSQINPPGPADLIKTVSKETNSLTDSTTASKTKYFYTIRAFAGSDTYDGMYYQRYLKWRIRELNG